MTQPQDPTTCVPDIPDVQGSVNKAIATAEGKVAGISFSPVNFDLDIGNFFTFDVFGKILGSGGSGGSGGLGFDICAICDSGNIDGAIDNSLLGPGGIGGLQSQVDSLQNQLDSAP